MYVRWKLCVYDTKIYILQVYKLKEYIEIVTMVASGAQEYREWSIDI